MISVMLGAFGAHALKEHLTEQSLDSFQTATTYMMTHAIGLFIVGMMYRHYKKKAMLWSGNFFVMGIIFFSSRRRHTRSSTVSWAGDVYKRQD